MNETDAAWIFRLNLQLSTETLTAAAPEIETLGLEAKEFFVLDGLEEHPYPAELARHLSMPKPTITLYLKNLQGKGFMLRAIDPEDLRRHRLELTRLGRETVTAARAILSARYGEKLDRLTHGEREELSRLLTKLTAS